MIEKKKLIKSGLFVFIWLLIVTVLYIMSYLKEKKYEFNGRIDNIHYGEKRIPIITINGKHYIMNTNWRFNERMNVGDSLIKEKGSMLYKLIKKRTGEVVFSTI